MLTRAKEFLRVAFAAFNGRDLDATNVGLVPVAAQAGDVGRGGAGAAREVGGCGWEVAGWCMSPVDRSDDRLGSVLGRDVPA